MEKTIFLTIVGIIFTLSPMMVKAQTIETWQQQSSQIQNTPTQIISTPAPAPESKSSVSELGFCSQITRNLSRGMKDIKYPGDIATLQYFLTKEGSYTYPKITGYFGRITLKAVKTFQKKNGIVMSGTPRTTGYGMVGPKTRSFINTSLREMCTTPKPIEEPIVPPAPVPPIVDPVPDPVPPIVDPPILSPLPINNESLIKDITFKNGIVVNPVSPMVHNEVDRLIPFSSGADDPVVWTLSQWYSKESIEGTSPKHNPDGSVTYKNNLKSITFGPDGSFSLGVYATKEWSGAGKKNNQPWPHLLLTQVLLPKKPNNIHPALSPKDLVLHDQISYLKDLDEVRYKLNYSLLERGSNPKGYNKRTMAVQDQTTLFIQNRNPDSKKYGDFFYFNILLSDNRYSCSRVYARGDISSGKFIYSPASCDLIDPIKPGAVSGGVASDGVSTDRLINKDILPYIKKGFYKAKASGFLEGTNYEDLAIEKVVLGWESSAAIDTVSRYKDFEIILKKSTDTVNPPVIDPPVSTPPPTGDYTDMVRSAYSCILEREVDSAGLSYWSDILKSDKSNGVSNLFRGLFNSAEYVNKDDSDREYITKLYTCILGREADRFGYKNHLRHLKNGATRLQILDIFINSREFKSKYNLNTATASVDADTQIAAALETFKGLLESIDKRLRQ